MPLNRPLVYQTSKSISSQWEKTVVGPPLRASTSAKTHIFVLRRQLLSFIEKVGQLLKRVLTPDSAVLLGDLSERDLSLKGCD